MQSQTKPLLILLALAAAALLVWAASPLVIDVYDYETHIYFAAGRRAVLLPGECVHVRWAVENAHEVYLNDAWVAERSGEYVHCGMEALPKLNFNRRDGTSKTYTLDVAVLFPGILWALLALTLGVWAARRRAFAAFAKKAGLVLFGVVLALAAVEVALRLASTVPSGGYYIWPPNLRYVYRPDPDIFPGVEGPARFITNGVGMRGSAYLPDAPAYRILTVGGSTTECLYLDQEETWPHLLGERLGAWVGNVGKAGHASFHHVLAMEYLLPQFPAIDAVVVLVGANDVTPFLKLGESYLPAKQDPHVQQEEKLRLTFTGLPPGGIKSLHLWRWIESLVKQQTQEGYIHQDTEGQWLQWERQNRRQAVRFLDSPPSTLDAALAQYRANLLALTDAARAQEVRLVLVTQPHAYRPDAPKHIQARWFAGWAEEPGVYYTAEVSAAVWDAFNRELLDVCAAREAVECVDLAGAMNGAFDYFLDEMHFNEAGAVRVAEVLAEAMD